MIPKEINGYAVLTVKFNEESEAGHCMYVKAHSVREKSQEKPADRTLFILGVPPYATEDSLSTAFSVCGKVSAVYIHAKPISSAPPKSDSRFFKDLPDVKGFKVGYIVFESSLSVSKALELGPDATLFLSTPQAPLLTGLQKWCKEYNERLVDGGDLQKEIDLYMAEYDKKAEQRDQALKAAAEPDSEGWVTVTKKGRNPGFSRKESVGKQIMKKESKKRSKKQLLNFYRFQIKESKMNHIMSLRDKFEDDKKKLNLIKQTRKFKPS